MNALQLQFIEESRELLEGVGEALLKFEKAPEDFDNLNALFRQVHTLKGNSGLFEELAPLVTVLHAAEDTLDLVRSAKHQLGPQETDLLMEVMDFVVASLDAWESGGFHPVEQMPLARTLADRLVSGRSGGATIISPPVLNEPFPLSNNLAPWFSEVIDSLSDVSGRYVCITYTPEPSCFFKGEDPLQLILSAPSLVYTEVRPVGNWNNPVAFDFYECQIEIRAISTAELSQLQKVFEYVSEQVVLTEVCNTVCEDSNSVELHLPPLPDAMRTSLAKIWSTQASMLAMIPVGDSTWQGKASAAVAAICAISKAAARPSWEASARRMLADAIHEDSINTLRTWVAQLPDDLLDTAGQLESLSSAATSTAIVHDPDTKSLSVLKVTREKVDRLMELIGEMVVAKNALPYLADRAEQEFSCRELSREIKANHSVINRIAEEMQDAIMQVRMLPVGTVFQRFPRLVRDLSKKLGKQIRLDVTGDETEADKNMIESLSEPLIHLLRNSLDHGIESPQARLLAGKPAEGVISIHAWQEADRVNIRIRDDGSGIDPAKLKEKALQKGLLPIEKLESMSEKDLLQLIFMPGFSTADQISDVSGRGVGMDVVRSAIARVHGQIDLQSVLGVGTTLTLSLPLSMAVNKVMMIEVANQQFGLPMEVVVETVRVAEDAIHQIQGQKATVLRGKIIPLVNLHGLLGLSDSPRMNDQNELAVLVARIGHETVGVVVDEFESTIDILLRPLDGVLSGMHQYSGSALLGDGTVLLILNLTEVLSCQ